MNTIYLNKTAARVRAGNFRAWSRQQISSKGRRFGEGCVRDYVSALRNYSKRLDPDAFRESGLPGDLFEIADALELTRAIAIIRTMRGYGTYIVEDHNRFEPAAALYRRYLAELSRKEGN